MLEFVLLVVIFVYGFWIWLVLGFVMLLVAFRFRGGARVALLVCAAISGLVGVAGGFFLEGMVESQNKFAEDSNRYLDLACAERAKFELPSALPAPQLGVRWIDDHDGRANPLATREGPEALVAPGRGLYQLVQIVGGYRQTGDNEALAWDEERALREALLKRVPVAPGALRYSVRTRSATTKRDSEFGVSALETVVTDERDGSVIARRVALGRSYAAGDPRPRGCPDESVAHSGCAGATCSVIPFLVAAVPPQPPAELRQAFHLLRGMGPRTLHCASDLYVAPGVAPTDLVWWRQGGQAVALAIAGTDDVLVCDSFYLMSQDSIRFRDGNRTFDISVMRAPEGGADRSSPQPFLQTAVERARAAAPSRLN